MIQVLISIGLCLLASLVASLFIGWVMTIKDCPETECD